VDSTRETLEKSIELVVSLTSLSRWHDAPANEGGSILPASLEKGSRGLGAASTDRTTADLSPARGLGARQRTSIYEAAPSVIGTQAGQHEGNNPEGITEHVDSSLNAFSVSLLLSSTEGSSNTTRFTDRRNLLLESLIDGTAHSSSAYYRHKSSSAHSTTWVSAKGLVLSDRQN
jgi:hypothetical protein